jgi:hypothetical protein
MIKSRYLRAIAAGSLLWLLPQAAPAQDARPVPPPPLKPGQSAGVQTAQQTHTGLALIGTGAMIAVVVVAATASNSGSSNNQVNPQFAPATTVP